MLCSENESCTSLPVPGPSVDILFHRRFCRCFFVVQNITDMRYLLLIFVSLAAQALLLAQPYTVPNGHTRHRFAQLELGATQYFSSKSGKTQVSAGDRAVDYQFGKSTTSAIFIGGTHFWGHCDFALTLPLFSIGDGMKYGIDLQAKYFHWAIRHNKLRPYVGVSMNPFGYSQNDGPTVTKTYFPLLAGLNYSRNGHQVELGALYNYNSSFDYYITRTQIGQGAVQPFIFNFTYKYTLETTGGAERNWRNGETAKRTKLLADSGKLNNFSVAVGPTSTFRMKNSAYLSKKYPFAGQHSYNSAMEYGLGYYWHKPDLHANIAYRQFKSKIDAYGYTQTAQRKALTVEVFKFLGDYHGFIPFAGPNISYEQLLVSESDFGVDKGRTTFRGWRPGLSFGWDIRPDRLQSWILRTNLRWYPNLNVVMPDGQKNHMNQLEFNFIQLVLYPERMFGKNR